MYSFRQRGGTDCLSRRDDIIDVATFDDYCLCVIIIDVDNMDM